jgi:hypothetical protein
MELFGLEIKRRVKRDGLEEPEKVLKSFVPPTEEEGVQTITSATGGYYGQYYDMDGSQTLGEKELIMKYREASEQPETDAAIDDIVNESISSDEKGASVELMLDDLQYEEEIKKKILMEFDHILKLYNFNEHGIDFFRRWYIDGKIYFHMVVDSNAPQDGIQEIRYVDPLYIRKVREIKEQTDRVTGLKISEKVDEFFVYTEPDTYAATTGQITVAGDSVTGAKIAEEAIVYVTSGVMDATRKKVHSYLHKSLKLINQLRMMEDALVIYRISRAPERRIFYIDVGNLPKGKAEEYVRNMMSQYRNKIVYDQATGEVRDDRRHQSMMEDFFLPRREGGRGTEITTLPGGENLGQIEDILFFQKKLYKSLNVPVSRLEAETPFQLGRATEINREEVKFQRFIERLRQRFSYIMLDALKTQLILKGVIEESDWDNMKEEINISFLKDNYFAELKEFEVMRDRFDVASQVEP